MSGPRLPYKWGHTDKPSASGNQQVLLQRNAALRDERLVGAGRVRGPKKAEA